MFRASATNSKMNARFFNKEPKKDLYTISQNTQVLYTPETVEVRLYATSIMLYDLLTHHIEFTLGGWNTDTTVNRLEALFGYMYANSILPWHIRLRKKPTISIGKEEIPFDPHHTFVIEDADIYSSTSKYNAKFPDFFTLRDEYLKQREVEKEAKRIARAERAAQARARRAKAVRFGDLL